MRFPLPSGWRLLLACCVWTALAALSATAAPSKVIIHDRGSIKELFNDRAAARMSLSELRGQVHVYGLGSLSGLRGEILVWDSQPFVSRIRSGEIQVSSDWNETAAYFVWASVCKWQRTKVPPSVRTPEMLEMWLSSMAGKPGAPLPSQFPFLIKGHFGRILWHIVDVRQDSPFTAAHVQEQIYHGRSFNTNAQIVGFYSQYHQGLFIPENQRTHMHVKIAGEVVAHVDDFDPFGDTGLILYAPVRK